MQIRHLLLLFALLSAGFAWAQAYRWVDEDGVVHFSDRPQPGAERVDLPETPRVPLGARTTPAAPAAETGPAEEEDTFPGYDTLEVTSPQAEETLWNIEGILSVSLNLQPALQPGHQVKVYFDGELRTVSGTSFQIEEVWRGVHNIQAEVQDENGQMLIRSRTNRFYVQQSTVR